jgi:hypothetical protein
MQMVLTHYHVDTGWNVPLPNWDSEQTLVLVFGQADIQAYWSVLDHLKSYYSHSLLMGCSGTASILNGELYQTGLVVGVIKFEHTHIVQQTISANGSENAYASGKTLAQKINTPALQAVWLVGDGMTMNTTEFLSGFNQHLVKQVPVLGGLASGLADSKYVWVLEHGVPVSNRMCAIGFYGAHLVTAGVANDGWKTFGLKRVVTKAHRNIVLEIDHKPALEIYKQYLGERCKTVQNFNLYYPLALWSADNSHYVVRAIFSADEIQRSLALSADIVEGSQIQFMYGYLDSLVEAAEMAASTVLQQLPQQDKPLLILTVSCVGRQLAMGDETAQELKAMCDVLPNNSQQIGFYSFGEIAPASNQAYCSLHNETMTVMALYEQI